LLEDQVPPAVPSVSAVVEPVQTEVLPLIEPGCVFTVTDCDTAQPDGSVYTILEVPVVDGLATPVDPTMDTTPENELVQLPPAIPSVNVVETPVHNDVLPTMGSGDWFTVIVFIAKQEPTV
jgi:hypothetical protein